MTLGCSAVDAPADGCDAIEADLDAAYTEQYNAEQDAASTAETVDKLTVRIVSDADTIAALRAELVELKSYNAAILRDNEIVHEDAYSAIALAAEQLAGCTERNSDLVRIIQAVPVDFVKCEIAPWVCEMHGVTK